MFYTVLVTCPDLKSSRRMAKAVLSQKAAACVNIVPGVESHYWWEGKITRSSEHLLLMKTTRQKLALLKKVVLETHPYSVPEFVALPFKKGSKDYLHWVKQSVK